MILLAPPGSPERVMMEGGVNLKIERLGKRGKERKMRMKEEKGKKERKTQGREMEKE